MQNRRMQEPLEPLEALAEPQARLCRSLTRWRCGLDTRSIIAMEHPATLTEDHMRFLFLRHTGFVFLLIRLCLSCQLVMHSGAAQACGYSSHCLWCMWFSYKHYRVKSLND